MVELINQDFLKNKELYNAISLELHTLLGDSVHIDHVGSTAIPNIMGKNIIDILVGVEDSVEFRRCGELLQSKGYCPSEKSKTDIYQFFASTTQETKSGDTHIHLVVMGTDRYDEFIILRDYLLENPDEALAYSNYKKDILTLNLSRAEYREVKSRYVSALIERAREYKEKR